MTFPGKLLQVTYGSACKSPRTKALKRLKIKKPKIKTNIKRGKIKNESNLCY